MAYETSDKLKLETNIPETIALEFDKGLSVSGKYGDQVMFTLTDGRKWYAPPFVAAKIEAAGIPAGVFFTLTKREVVEGNRRRVEYQIGDAMAPAAPAAAPAPPKENGLATRNSAAVSSIQQIPQPPMVRPSQLSVTHSNAVPVAAPVVAIDGGSAVALLKIAGCGAIDAVLAIEQYACDRGLTDFVFGPENIQKMAVTLFLEMSRKTGRAA